VSKVEGPEVILVVGVNGTGKQQPIGKLAGVLRGQGKTVLSWPLPIRFAPPQSIGGRFGASAQELKSLRRSLAAIRPPCSMTLCSPQTRKTDYVIVDTAGRLHTKTNDVGA
jgi:fused signal recognition particle receptor